MKYLFVSIILFLSIITVKSQDLVVELDLTRSKFNTENAGFGFIEYCGLVECIFLLPEMQYENGIGINLLHPMNGKFEFIFGMEYSSWTFEKTPYSQKLNPLRLTVIDDSYNSYYSNSVFTSNVGLRYNLLDYDRFKFFVENKISMGYMRMDDLRLHLFAVQPSMGIIKYFNSSLGLRIAYQCKQYFNDLSSVEDDKSRPFSHGFKLGINIDF